MSRPAWAPPEVDVNRPSAARVYDFYLGGSHNFEVDRQMAREAIQMWPDLPRIMRSNRAFLRRAVRHLAGEGITQFIDIGSGIPTAGNVHEVAQYWAPDSRVVYVDRDPVAVAHSRAILADDTQTGVVQADLREPERIFDDPAVLSLIDLEQPVALLLVAVLHFVPDEDRPTDAVGWIRERLSTGSRIVISHASSDGRPTLAASHQTLYQRTPTPMTMRTRDEIALLFDGFTLEPPGLVWLPMWRPDEDEIAAHPEQTTGYAGVGRKE